MHKTPLYSQVEFSHSALKIYTITVSCKHSTIFDEIFKRRQYRFVTHII